jgi:broad specificity phosphatase PhoE
VSGDRRPVRLYLVRHGRAAAGWTEDADPDLDDLGRSQAAATASGLAGRGPLPVVSSPLRRARSTAAAFEQIWNVAATVEPRVGEIPSPTGPEGSLDQRGPWLRRVMLARWGDPHIGPELEDWRRGLIDALVALGEDTVVTTHFVAINTAVGKASGDGRVTSFRPDNCSCTVLEVVGGSLRLITLGEEAPSEVR